MGKWGLIITFGQVHVNHGEPQLTSLVHYITFPRRSLSIQVSDEMWIDTVEAFFEKPGNLTLRCTG